MRKQTKIAAIVSAAALLALGASMTSFAATGWQEENGVWVYYNRQGEQVTDTWAKSGEAWFYLNDQGEMATDSLIESNDALYYVDANGAMVTERWVAVDNENAGEDKNEPNTIWYYFGANGKAYKGGNRINLKTINGKKYTFNEDGKMLYGWVSDSGEMVNSDDENEWQQGTYYFGDENDGAMTVGWKLISITANDSDDAQPGDGFWDNAQDRWFYFKSSGKKEKDKKDGTSINGAKYAFDENGRMIADWYTATPDTASQGMASYSSSFRYFSTPEDGARKTKGWFKVVAGYYLNTEDYENGSEAWYYADGSGKIVANKIMVINGKRYAFDNKGKMRSGLVFLEKANVSSRDVVGIENAPDNIDKLVDFVNNNADAVNAGLKGAYYFGDDSDGSMKTGNQTVSFDDQNTKWSFKTASAIMGVGNNGFSKKDNKFYIAGLAYAANSDDKFAAIAYDSVTKTVTRLQSQNDIVALGTFVNRDSKGDHYSFNSTTVSIYVVNTSGTVVKSGSKKDGLGNVLSMKGSKLVGYTVAN